MLSSLQTKAGVLGPSKRGNCRCESLEGTRRLCLERAEMAVEGGARLRRLGLNRGVVWSNISRVLEGPPRRAVVWSGDRRPALVSILYVKGQQ